jgi:Spy/CpxP family protein refolding chaperone
VLKKNNDDLRSVLTDEQKKQYDEFLGRMTGGGNRQNERGGQRFGGGLPRTDDLKRQLELTDEQVTKINEIRDEVREALGELFRNGGMRSEENQKKAEELRDSVNKRVRDTLTDAQKPKFDDIVKQSQGDGPRPPQRGGERGRGPAVEDRLREVMESVKIENADEAAAVREAAKKVIEAQQALGDFDRESRGKVSELARKTDATEEEIKAAVEELRAGRRDKDKAVRDAQKSLSEIVTYKQELELIRHGLLR